MGGHVACMGKAVLYKEFWWETLRERGHLKNPGVDERIILRWIFKKWDVGGIDWIELVEHRDRCQFLVNAIMNLRVP
jgi:hypothetical protein